MTLAHRPAAARVGPVRRALLALVLALALLIAVLIGLDSSIAAEMRCWVIGFSSMLLSLLGIGIKIWSEPDLRSIPFAKRGRSISTSSRFLRRYHERFGTDLWLVLFLLSVLVCLAGHAIGSFSSS